MREIRLDGLRDVPDAFGSTYARDAAFEPGVVELISMFVRPQARGHGVGEALVDAVVAWAKDEGATLVHLWVTESNQPAVRLYERCGFTVTPERQPLPSNPALGEVGMTRPL